MYKYMLQQVTSLLGTYANDCQYCHRSDITDQDIQRLIKAIAETRFTVYDSTSSGSTTDLEFFMTVRYLRFCNLLLLIIVLFLYV